jgi:hypothetical protein
MARIVERRKNKRIFKKKIAVLYHGGCNDGFGGAWAAWKKFGARADYIPMYRSENAPDLRGKDLYFIDFTLSAGEMARLIRVNKRVTAIDHHISAKEAALLTKAPSFSLDNSGAVLAWRYFHPGRKIPLLLRYIEDRDLWRWKLPQSREILAGTNFSEEKSWTFRGFGELAADFEKPAYRRQCVKDGRIVDGVWRLVENYLSGLAEPVSFGGVRAMAVNSPHLFASRVGNFLVRERGAPLAIIWNVLSGAVHVSLRSGGKVDCAKLAEKYGGGGHKAAAGFILKDVKNIPWKRIKHAKA